MKIPHKWTELPCCIRESLIRSVDDLDYDHYESSRAQAIENLLNNPENESINYNKVQAYYAGLNEVEFLGIVTIQWCYLRTELEAVEKLLPI